MHYSVPTAVESEPASLSDSKNFGRADFRLINPLKSAQRALITALALRGGRKTMKCIKLVKMSFRFDLVREVSIIDSTKYLLGLYGYPRTVAQHET